MKKQENPSPQEVLARLQNLCSRCEKCVYDVRTKLALWKIDRAEADKIVERLLADGFVDEQRYALAYVREKSNIAKWGIQKISRMLSAKQLPVDAIKQALEEVNVDKYEEDLLKLLRKKSGTIKAATKSDHKAKLLRFSLSRGYEYELSLKIVEMVMGCDDVLD